MPQMKKVYNEQTGYTLEIFHLKNGTAEICTMLGQKEIFKL